MRPMKRQLRSIAWSLALALGTVAAPTLPGMIAVTGSVVRAEEGEQPTELEKSVDELLAEFSTGLDEAITSLERTNASLDDALAMKDIEGALATVGNILSKVNNLADRMRPGNATEGRVDSLLRQTDQLIETLQSDDGLLPEDKEHRLNKVMSVKTILDAHKQRFAKTYKDLTGVAEDLKSQRRAIAYDVIIDAYSKAANSLNDTNDRIDALIDSLRDYLAQFRAPLTN